MASSSSNNATNDDATRPTTTTTRSIADTVRNDEKMKVLHDAVEKDLIGVVCKWILRVMIFGAGGGAFFGYLGGHANYTNPLVVSVVAIGLSYLNESREVQMGAFISLIVYVTTVHALTQGCSASLVPAIQGFIPCAAGFVFRTPRAVILSTVGVLVAITIIYSIDLAGNCASDPLAPDDTGGILADRLTPLLMLVLGNCSILVAIVRQSQESLLLHAKATRSAARLADIRRNVLHRVTHELRTPLNGIIGSVELLVGSDDMNEQDMENAMTIKRCMTNIVRICDDVLMAAKFKEADRVRKENAFSLASCVDDVSEMFAVSAAAKGIKLKVEFVGDTTLTVRGMEAELRHVLLNLAGNALKFTDTGSITIRVRTEDESTPSADSSSLRCLFEVEDTGIGIDSESSDMLFDAFHQGEQGGAISRRHKGTGLGLTICKELVETMGGKITVDGARGRGSRFSFTLVFHKELRASTDSYSSTDQRNNEGSDNPIEECRIVIADSEMESSASCQSIAKSVASSANISMVRSPSALLKLVARLKEEAASTGTRRIAFVECDTMDTNSLVSTLSSIRESGWIVFAYSDQRGFPLLAANSVDAYAVFRRPAQLVRMGNTLRDALAGAPPLKRTQPQPTREKNSSEASTTEDGSRGHEDFTKDQRLEIGASEAYTVDASVSKKAESKIAGTTRQPLAPVERTNAAAKRPLLKEAAVTLRPGAKLVVVDDTPINLKVLVKMLSRTTTVPVLSCLDGQSAVDLVAAASCEDLLLFLMDWHMPGLCGLSATRIIRQMVKDRGGPTVFFCMVTADLEGLQEEMNRCQLSYEGTISNGEMVKCSDDTDKDQASTSGNEDGSSSSEMGPTSPLLEKSEESDEFTVVDIVTEKPVTFKTINTVLSWFDDRSRNVEIVAAI